MNLHLSWADLRNYAVILAVFLVIDGIWLLVIAKKLYAQQLGYLMAEKPRLFAALLFYLLFVLGLQGFVVNPALAAGHVSAALLPGLLFGLITYATYDLTNLATVRDWPVLITVIDLAWGSFVSAAGIHGQLLDHPPFLIRPGYSSIGINVPPDNRYCLPASGRHCFIPGIRTFSGVRLCSGTSVLGAISVSRYFSCAGSAWPPLRMDR